MMALRMARLGGSGSVGPPRGNGVWSGGSLHRAKREDEVRGLGRRVGREGGGLVGLTGGIAVDCGGEQESGTSY